MALSSTLKNIDIGGMSMFWISPLLNVALPFLSILRTFAGASPAAVAMSAVHPKAAVVLTIATIRIRPTADTQSWNLTDKELLTNDTQFASRMTFNA